jgi:hypothetical protein
VNETVSDLIQEVSRLLTVIHLLSRSVQDILVHSSCATGTTEVKSGSELEERLLDCIRHR